MLPKVGDIFYREIIGEMMLKVRITRLTKSEIQYKVLEILAGTEHNLKVGDTTEFNILISNDSKHRFIPWYEIEIKKEIQEVMEE